MKRKSIALFLRILLALSVIATYAVKAEAFWQKNIHNQSLQIQQQAIQMPALEHKTYVPTGFIGIRSATELASIANNLDGKFILMNNIDLSSFGNWTPIGSADTPFRGELDGNGYTISNLSINASVSHDTFVDGRHAYYGLFAVIDGTRIHDLFIDNANISINTELTPVSAGILVGGTDMSGCEIQNVYISASSLSVVSDTYACVGSIMGQDIWSVIENCISDVRINCQGGVAVGGIAGRCFSLSRCFFTGSIEAEAMYVTRVGGIAGSACTIAECANNGSIMATIRNDEWLPIDGSDAVIAGGIVGSLHPIFADAEVRDCYNNGAVDVSINNKEIIEPTDYTAEVFVGGICGETRDYYGREHIIPISLKNLFNSGEISVSCISERTDVSMVIPRIQFAIGEVFGYALSQDKNAIKNCYYLNNQITYIDGINASGIKPSNSVTTRSICKQVSSSAASSMNAYTGFDFSKIWEIDISILKYPILRWVSRYAVTKSSVQLAELNDVDYLAFSELAYHDFDLSDMGKTIKEYLETKSILDKEWAQGISYQELYCNIMSWKLHSSITDKSTGHSTFSAVSFANNQQEKVVAYRGTDDELLTTDLAMILNRNSMQVEFAISYFNDIKGSLDKGRIVVTGHSLGGGLAEIVSAYSGCKGVTFNSAPFIDIAYSYYPDIMSRCFEGTDKWNYLDHINEKDKAVGMLQMEIKNRKIHMHNGSVPDPNRDGLKKRMFFHHYMETLVVRDSDGNLSLTDGKRYPADANIWHMRGLNDSNLLGRCLYLGSSNDDELGMFTDIRGYVLDAMYNIRAFGGDGDDYIITGPADDWVAGGKGTDYLSGYRGNDTYIYYKGDGVDYIADPRGKDKLLLLGFDESDIIEAKTTPDSEYIDIQCNSEVIVRIYREYRDRWHTENFTIAVKRGDKVEEKKIDKDMFESMNYANSFVIACPVDVEILNSNGSVVQVVRDGAQSIYTGDFGIAFVIKAENESGYSKVIDLVEGYTLRVIGREEGTMDIALWDYVNGELSETCDMSENINVSKNMIALFSENSFSSIEIDYDNDGVADAQIPFRNEIVERATDVPIENAQTEIPTEDVDTTPELTASSNNASRSNNAIVIALAASGVLLAVIATAVVVYRAKKKQESMK